MSYIDDEEATRLDGNAAAGVLTQLFCGEPSPRNEDVRSGDD